jgi:hypothetical protein
MNKLVGKKEQLRKQVWTRIQMYVTAKDTFQYAKYLYLPETDEERIYIHTDTHLKVFRTYFWRLCLTETAKLVSSREHDEFRISALVSNLSFQDIMVT